MTPAVLEADRVFGALVSAWLDAGEPAETDLGTLSSEALALLAPLPARQLGLALSRAAYLYARKWRESFPDDESARRVLDCVLLKLAAQEAVPGG